MFHQLWNCITRIFIFTPERFHNITRYVLFFFFVWVENLQKKTIQYENWLNFFMPSFTLNIVSLYCYMLYRAAVDFSVAVVMHWKHMIDIKSSQYQFLISCKNDEQFLLGFYCCCTGQVRQICSMRYHFAMYFLLYKYTK